MSRSERSLVLVLGFAVSLTYLHHAYTSYRANVSGDYYQFWVVGQALSSLDLSDPYSEPDRTRIGEEFWRRARAEGEQSFEQSARYRRDRIEPAATPFLYGVFRAFSTGRYATDYELFRVLSFLGYAAAVLSLAHMVGLSLPLAGLLLLLTTEWFWPFRIEVAHSNVNQLQVAALAAALALRRVSAAPPVSFAVGAVLGLLLLFKPNLLYAIALLLAYWMFSIPLRRWWVLALGFSAGALFGLLTPGLLFGSLECWSNWLQGSGAILQSPDYLRRSLPRLLGFAPPVWSFWLAGGLLCVPVLALALRARSASREERLQRERLVVAAGALVLVLCSPVVHVHYFVLTVPALICLLAPGIDGREFSVAGVTLRHALAVVSLLLIGGLFGAHFTLWPFLGAALLYLTTLARLALPAFGAPSAEAGAAA